MKREDLRRCSIKESLNYAILKDSKNTMQRGQEDEEEQEKRKGKKGLRSFHLDKKGGQKYT